MDESRWPATPRSKQARVFSDRDFWERRRQNSGPGLFRQGRVAQGQRCSESKPRKRGEISNLSRASASWGCRHSPRVFCRGFLFMSLAVSLRFAWPRARNHFSYSCFAAPINPFRRRDRLCKPVSRPRVSHVLQCLTATIAAYGPNFGPNDTVQSY
jgi:hypothetical protein